MAENEPPVPNVRKIETYGAAERTVALMFCSAGQHATVHAFTYDGSGWCPEHLPPVGPEDPLPPGQCEWSKPHYAKGGVRLLPGITSPTVRAPRHLCGPHLAALLHDVWHRGDYGRRA